MKVFRNLINTSLVVLLSLLFIFFVNSNSFADELIPNSNDKFAEIKEGICEIYPHKIEDVQLVTEIAEIPITIANTCDFSVPVSLMITSSNDNIFKITANNISVNVEGNSSTVASIPVSASSNGQFSMNVVLSAADGVSYDEWKIDVNSIREIGTAISLFFYLVVGFLIVVGIYRTIKRSVKGKK